MRDCAPSFCLRVFALLGVVVGYELTWIWERRLVLNTSNRAEPESTGTLNFGLLGSGLGAHYC